MLKRLAIVVFLAVVLPIHGQGKSSQPAGDQTQADRSEKPPLPPGTATCKVKEDGTAIECNWAETESESYFKRLFSPENTPNIALLLVGIGGIVVALCTLKIIERQTKATEDAAKAALLNIQAFINSERPWISVKIEPSERKHAYRIVATNKGRTPAAMISHAENRILIGTLELPPDIALYGEPDDRPRMILPEESIVLLEISEYSFVGKDEGKIAQFRNIDAEGYVFGIITYRDLLGSAADKPRETRWAFHVLSWQDGDVILCDYTVGGDEYTVHT